jgi:transcriptional regulator with XRE-family HTH domain
MKRSALEEALYPFKSAGDLVRWKREQKKISLRSMATIVGISPSAMSQIEAGVIRPSHETALKIMSGLMFAVAEKGRLISAWSKPDVDAVARWNTLWMASA